MGLNHAVITSVTRDDLKQGGATIFADTVRAVRQRSPDGTVEVLIPDFQGDWKALDIVISARPDILGHNVETVPRLYPEVRPQARYDLSLDVLRKAREMDPSVIIKSGIMVGLGESMEEIGGVMDDLRDVGCDILTIGQYLRPGPGHHPVVRYYLPEEFEDLKAQGLAGGFRWVESGPLVRSSYHADEQARVLIENQKPPSGRSPSRRGN
jgi:lipoic acid synthetase